MARKNHDQEAVRRYLLEPLSASEKESIEYRVLSDEAFSEELEIVEDELIDEYLADELSRADRKNFEKYFLAHPARREKLEGGRVLRRYLGNAPSPKPSFIEYLRRWVQQFFFPSSSGLAVATTGGPVSLAVVPIRAVVALTLVLVTGVALWLILGRQSDVQKGLLALDDAYRLQRPIEPRVSRLNHAPFITTRGNAEPANVNTLERDLANRYLLDAYQAHPNAGSAHALGKLYLMQQDPDKAIHYLEEARDGDPGNAQIYADLGAAYFEKAKHAPGTESGRSIEYFNKALELNSNLPEALFNRALAYQYQGLDHLAEADWRAYLQKDPNSPWAIEAQQKLKQLEDKKRSTENPGKPLNRFMHAYRARDGNSAWQVYKSNYTPSGNLITKALLDELLSDKSKYYEHLHALKFLGQLELHQTQDPYTSDLFKVYYSASSEKQTLLTQARNELESGFKLYRNSQLTEAQKFFVTARDAFEKLNNLPEALVAEGAIAHVATLEPDLVKAQKLYARLVPQCEQRNYKWFMAQTLTRRAHMESNLNNHSKAVSDANKALELFQELDDPNGILGGFTQLASFHYSLKDHESSFSYLRKARAMAETQPVASSDIWMIHITTALNFNALKLYRAALDFEREALKIAFEINRPIHLSRTYQNLGLSYGYLGLFEPALKNLLLAYDHGKRIPQERLGQNIMAASSLKLGDFYRASGDPASALAAYDESLRLYEQLDFPHYIYAAHKGKFLSYLEQQNDALADQELQTVLKLFHMYRQKIVTERQVTHFFDREQDIYDLAIDFAYSRLGDQRRAFEYSEISRARNLRELMVHGARVTLSDRGPDLQPAVTNQAQQVEPLTAAEIEQQVPEQVQIVQLAVLEKQLLIWHISRSGIIPTAVSIESSKLTEAVVTALEQIRQRDEPGATASLKSLHRLIIDPIKDRLDPNKALCFVPDKALHYLPWSALISERSGRYLFQEFRWMTAPSATILIDSTNKAFRRTRVKNERLLAVGNPTFDRAAYQGLANLPAAEREVESIARYYLSPVRLLVGPKATRKSVLGEVAHADVIHFAGHYEVDPLSTLSSKLILAQAPGERSHAEPSDLTAADICDLNLRRTRLVVLAGCKTAIERDFGGEGPIGFARSFLVAGVPVVVASLWPVDSDATSQLMIEFHRFRKEMSTTHALMRAQQEIMAQPGYQSPYYWAGFTVVGGYARY